MEYPLHSDEDNFRSRGLLGWFINNPVVGNILAVLLVIGGAISATGMRSETFPPIDPLLIVVSVSYPGATPYEVATAITGRIEPLLEGITGVKDVYSEAVAGNGTVNVQLEDFADDDRALREIKTAVAGIVNFPPKDAREPMVLRIDVAPRNIISLVLSGDVDEGQLYFWAHKIKKDLVGLQYVSRTVISGVRDYEVSIEVSEDSLREYGLTLRDIVNAVNNFSQDISAGTIESRQGDIDLRIQEKRYSKDDFESIVVRTLSDGSSLYLGDIANIIDDFKDINLISRLDGKRAAFIEVRGDSKSSIIDASDEVKDYLSTLKMPRDMKLSIYKDDTVDLRDRIDLILKNGILGVVLVFIILMLFLDIRLAFWVSCSIPISFLGGIFILSFFDYSINMIVLFAMLIMLGIVVDDSIIVGESIFEHQRMYPGDLNITEKAVRAVYAPVTIGVLTTIASFLPLALSDGILGQIIRSIPVVATVVLCISLVEAYFILPVHLSTSKRWSRGVVADIRNKVSVYLERFVDDFLLPFVRFAIKWRYATVAAFVGVCIVIAGMVSSGVIRFIFFPGVSSDYIEIKINTPVGTPFEDTRDTTMKIVDKINAIRDDLEKDGTKVFESISVRVGHIGEKVSSFGYQGSITSNQVSNVGIKLVPVSMQEYSSFDIEDMIRDQIEGTISGIDGITFSSSEIKSDADVRVDLFHASEDILHEATDVLKQSISSLHGIKEVADSLVEGNMEYIFKLNEQGLAVGLTPASLGDQLRSAYFGVEVARFHRDDSDKEVVAFVRYPKEERERLSTLEKTRIRVPGSGQEVSLMAVADIVVQRGYSSIQTVNGRRVVSVTANVGIGEVTPLDVRNTLQNVLLPSLLQQYDGLDYEFAGDSKQQKEDLSGLLRNMLTAALLIYILLGAQLRSYLQPVIVMTVIPFGLFGAVLGHWVLGYDLTFISLFGMIALMGVLVNDSVVLIDYYNKIGDMERSIIDRVIIVVKRRFRPVLLTTLSTSLAMLPILAEKSMQAQFLQPMAVSLATGILFATFVVIILLPCLLVIYDDIRYRLRAG